MAVIVSIVVLFQMRVNFLTLPMITPIVVVTVFLKSLSCPVSKSILIGLRSLDTVNRGFSFFVCTFGARFFTVC
jgi:hypothetical protein